MSPLKKEKLGEKEEELAVRSLFNRKIRPIRNWHEWLTHWQVAETLEEILGLLHVGFNVPLEAFNWREKKYDEINRLISYFTIADGWSDYFLFENSEDGDKTYWVYSKKRGILMEQKLCKLRQELAAKAFSMLCLNFFNLDLYLKDSQRKFKPEWREVVASERLFPVIQNFFQVQEEKFFPKKMIIRNLTVNGKKSHHERMAIKFLINLANFAWKWEEETWLCPYGKEEELEKEREVFCSRLDSAKPWLIEVLSFLGRLDVLEKWILELDESCLKKLEEIALRNKFSKYCHSVKEDRPVATLDEARFLNSSAAWLLAKHKLMKKEQERLNKILIAERKRETAEDELNKLNAKE